MSLRPVDLPLSYDSLRFDPAVPDETKQRPFAETLLPPAELIHHVQKDADPVSWQRIGQEFLHYSRHIAQLKPSDAVLDIGCGAGRMAMALASFLDESARYEGFDVHAPSIAWAQRTYRRVLPQFHFRTIDLYNRVYNPTGTVDSASLVFPYKDASFDLTLLTSIFTHMLPRDVAHYWEEIARTLKPGGRALVTAFLLNEESTPRLSNAANTIPLLYDLGNYRVADLGEPERIIGYSESFMKTLIAASGLDLVQVYRGAWCGRPEYLSYQDLMLVRRPIMG